MFKVLVFSLFFLSNCCFKYGLMLNELTTQDSLVSKTTPSDISAGVSTSGNHNTTVASTSTIISMDNITVITSASLISSVKPTTIMETTTPLQLNVKTDSIQDKNNTVISTTSAFSTKEATNMEGIKNTVLNATINQSNLNSIIPIVDNMLPSTTLTSSQAEIVLNSTILSSAATSTLDAVKTSSPIIKSSTPVKIEEIKLSSIISIVSNLNTTEATKTVQVEDFTTERTTKTTKIIQKEDLSIAASNSIPEVSKIAELKSTKPISTTATIASEKSQSSTVPIIKTTTTRESTLSSIIPNTTLSKIEEPIKNTPILTIIPEVSKVEELKFTKHISTTTTTIASEKSQSSTVPIVKTTTTRESTLSPIIPKINSSKIDDPTTTNVISTTASITKSSQTKSTITIPIVKSASSSIIPKTSLSKIEEPIKNTPILTIIPEVSKVEELKFTKHISTTTTIASEKSQSSTVPIIKTTTARESTLSSIIPKTLSNKIEEPIKNTSILTIIPEVSKTEDLITSKSISTTAAITKSQTPTIYTSTTMVSKTESIKKNTSSKVEETISTLISGDVNKIEELKTTKVISTITSISKSQLQSTITVPKTESTIIQTITKVAQTTRDDTSSSKIISTTQQVTEPSSKTQTTTTQIIQISTNIPSTTEATTIIEKNINISTTTNSSFANTGVLMVLLLSASNFLNLNFVVLMSILFAFVSILIIWLSCSLGLLCLSIKKHKKYGRKSAGPSVSSSTNTYRSYKKYHHLNDFLIDHDDTNAINVYQSFVSLNSFTKRNQQQVYEGTDDAAIEFEFEMIENRLSKSLSDLHRAHQVACKVDDNMKVKTILRERKNKQLMAITSKTTPIVAADGKTPGIVKFRTFKRYSRHLPSTPISPPMTPNMNRNSFPEPPSFNRNSYIFPEPLTAQESIINIPYTVEPVIFRNSKKQKVKHKTVFQPIGNSFSLPPPPSPPPERDSEC